MNVKKIAAVAMTAVMLFGMTACSLNKTSKYTKVLDKMKFTELKGKDINDFEDYAEDGCYAVVNDRKNIKSVSDYITDSVDVDLDGLRVVVAAAQLDEEADAQFYAYVFQFKSDKDAKSFFEDYSDFWEDEVSDSEDLLSSFGDLESEFGKSQSLVALSVSFLGESMDTRVGIYLDGSVVIVVASNGTSDAGEDCADLVTDFCDGAGLDDPSDLL